eukprot:CAMPEP_0197648368 /NCGR_PEP_ID=MMETSP1338-20131121/27712_1 /TAXON_ID=43686 ORGANISM="Pelagodinium beii, Strain RCC1491" /NCGR_SAMPLE_ID=MMETSP1338 /ASSEMBLY_ACC=CAM_ASM_000754 /LENGTH=60 /DNA_ID=CAMNT_0043222351 /DNA_START=174 /DNA_END=356 /DNA_ORIENTATION=-
MGGTQMQPSQKGGTSPVQPSKILPRTQVEFFRPAVAGLEPSKATKFGFLACKSPGAISKA